MWTQHVHLFARLLVTAQRTVHSWSGWDIGSGVQREGCSCAPGSSGWTCMQCRFNDWFCTISPQISHSTSLFQRSLYSGSCNCARSFALYKIFVLLNFKRLVIDTVCLVFTSRAIHSKTSTTKSNRQCATKSNRQCAHCPRKRSFATTLTVPVSPCQSI
jgi:hypothetical protein